MPPQPFQVLLVDDDPGDAGLAREALRAGKFHCATHYVASGEEALAFLRRQNGFEASPRPDIILLDLNMPGMNGWDVLVEMRNDPTLTEIPVVILTTSDYMMDVAKAYRLGANSFVSKPVDLMQFIKAVQGIKEYWFSIVKLPS